MFVGSTIAATDTFSNHYMTVSGPEIGLAGFIPMACGAYLVQAYLRYVRSSIPKHPVLVGVFLILLLIVVAMPLLESYEVIQWNKVFFFSCFAPLFPVAYVTHRALCKEWKSLKVRENIRRRQARGNPSQPNPGMERPHG